MLAGQLEIDFVTNMAKLVQDVQQGKSAVVSACMEMQTAAENVKKAFELVAVGFGAIKFAEFIRNALEGAAALEELSQRTGMTTESLSQLQYATKVSGLGAESLGQAMKKLQVSMANASAGDQLKIALFKQLGVTQADLGEGTQAVMLKMANAYAHAQDGAGKTALSIGLMGKAGDEMIPFLNRGAGAIRELMGEADALGLTIGSELAQKAKEFDENLNRVQAQSKTLAIYLGGAFVTNLTAAMQAFINATKEGDKFRGVLEAIRTLITGTDQQKSDKELIDLTNTLMTQQSYLDRLKNAGYTTDTKVVQSQLAQIAATKAQISTVLTYRAALDAEAEAKAKLAAKAKADREEGDRLAAQSKAAMAAAREEEAEYRKINDALQQRLEMGKKQLDEGRPLTEAEKLEIQITSQITNAKVALTEQHKKELLARLALATQRLRDIADQEREAKNAIFYHNERVSIQQDEIALDKQMTDHTLQVRDQLEWQGVALKNINEQMALEAQLMGATDKERTVAIALLQIEQQRLIDIEKIKRDSSESDKAGAIAKTNANAAAASANVQIKADLQEQIDLTNQLAGLGKNLWDDLWSGGHDTLKKLGQDIKKFLIDELYELVVRKWIVNIAANIVGAGSSGAIQGGASALAGGASGGGGLLSALLPGGGILSGVGNGLSAWGSGGSVMGVLSNPGLYTGAELLGAALPIIGGVALLAAALGAFKHGGPKTESGFGDAVPNRGDAAGASQIASTIQSSYAQIAQVLGVTNTHLQNLSVFYAQDPQGTAQTQLQVVGGAYARSDMYGGQYENVGRTDADFQNAVALASAQLILKNLQQQVQGPIGDFLKSVDLTSSSLDDINKALQIAQDVGTLEAALKGLGNTFANVTNLSVQNKEALVQQFGSVGNLTAALGTYYQNFYSATEQQNAALASLTATFQQAGLQIPATREAYRTLVEAQDLSTDAGRAAYTVLMQNAGAFASLVPAAQDAATAVQDVATTISDTMKRLLADNSKLQVQLLTLQGNTQAANDMQFAIDSAGMTPDEIAQLKSNQALQHSIDLLTAAQQRAQQVAQTGKQLQDQIWQAEGNTTALRQEELAALAKLDPSLVAMQQHLYDLQDQAAATNALLQTVDTSRQALVTSYQQEATALKQTADQATQFARSLEQFKQSLLVDSSASALNPRGRYAAARRNFQTIAGEAAAGDVTAEGQLQSVASAFLQASRTMFGSATPYGLDFRAVQNVLTQVEGSAQGQATQATQQLAVVQAQLDKLQSIDTGTKTIAQALADYTAAIIAAINAGLNPDNPLHLDTGAHTSVVQTSASRGQAANDAVVAAVNRVGERISRLENSNAAGHAIVARATQQGSQEVAKSVAARNWTDRVAAKGALK